MKNSGGAAAASNATAETANFDEFFSGNTPQ
jgi:hypothetical protein